MDSLFIIICSNYDINLWLGSGVKIQIPIKYQPLLLENHRFKVYYGGRGAGKSYNIALAFLILASQKKIKVLCVREYQSSIKDSVHALFKQIIHQYNFSNFEITEAEIRNIQTGSSFIFKGIKRDIDSIKSTQGITHCWAEEAEKISKSSWDDLIPTIREEGSEIWISFNPRHIKNETYQRFVVNGGDNVLAVLVNYYDNPFISQTLLQEMEDCKANRPISEYNHIWLGDPMKVSDAVVFKNRFEVKEFTTHSIDEMFSKRIFYGADWGFANDPNTIIRCYIVNNCLYIDHAIFDKHYKKEGVGYVIRGNPTELNNMPAFFDKMPNAKEWIVYADSARPETISYIRNRGYPSLMSVKKTSQDVKAINKGTSEGYVIDGIEYLKSFDMIYIHPRNIDLIIEFENYSYMQDKITEEILPKLEDNFNHGIDALRYALSPYIRRKPIMTA